MSDNKTNKNKSRRSTRKSSAGKSSSFTEEDINTSTLLSSTVAANDFSNYEYNNEEEYGETEGEGEGKEFSSSSIQNHRPTLTTAEQEKEFVEKLCRKIAENFWESAWNICAERFYNGNASSTIALELRDTWLRIIESQYLDQDQPNLLLDLPINILVPDEPPPLLVSSSPSMDLLIQSHQRSPGQNGNDEEEAEEVSVISDVEKGQGDMEEKKNKKKDSSDTRGKNGKNWQSTKRKQDNFSNKNGLRTKKLVSSNNNNKVDLKKKKKMIKDEIISSLETPANGQRAAPNTRDSLPNNNNEEEVEGKEKEIEVDEKIKAIEVSGCVERPKFKLEEVEDREIPWEVLFMAKHRFDDTLSRSISQEYRSLGLEPWTPSQCQLQSSGMFRFINESNSFAKNPADLLLQEQQEKQSGETSLVEPGGEKEIREKKSGEIKGKISPGSPGPEKKEPTKEFSLKAASVILDVPTEEKTAPANNNNDTGADISPKETSNIVERIDNLLHADSDHVVQILRPAEAGQMPTNASQEFDVHDSEFDEHFPKQTDNNNDGNNDGDDGKSTGERRPSPNLKKMQNERKKSIKKNSLAPVKKSLKTKSPRNSN